MRFRSSRPTADARGNHRSRIALASAATLTMTAAALLAAGAGPAGASITTLSPGPVSVPPMIPSHPIHVPPRHASSPAEHFQIVTTSAKGSKRSSIIATGAFAAGGTIGSGFGNAKTRTVVLPGGTFKVTAKHDTGSSVASRKSCLTVSHGNGTYTLHGGTGKYAKISGSGKFTLTSMTVGARDSKGTCSSAPAAYQEVINLTGSVKV